MKLCLVYCLLHSFSLLSLVFIELRAWTLKGIALIRVINFKLSLLYNSTGRSSVSVACALYCTYALHYLNSSFQDDLGISLQLAAETDWLLGLLGISSLKLIDDIRWIMIGIERKEWKLLTTMSIDPMLLLVSRLVLARGRDLEDPLEDWILKKLRLVLVGYQACHEAASSFAWVRP